jgi:hypothetical protein
MRYFTTEEVLEQSLGPVQGRMRLVPRICLKTILFCLPVVVPALMVSLAGTRLASAQTRPGYQELFEDPPRTDQLTQADLPNLGRLVVLEATSMFVHARSELLDSPASFRLLDEINTLWNSADAFTAAVAFSPNENQRIEAGRLVFPELEAAFHRVRTTLGTLPGIAPRSAENLANMSRAVAVIGPLLRQEPPGLPAAPNRGDADAAVLTNQARELSSAVAPLKTHVKAEAGRRATLKTLDREIDVLESLIQGFERISSSQASERELIAAFRPIRAGAQRINRELQRSGLTAGGLNLWQAIKQQIDDLEARFQLPREIVPRPSREDARPLDPTIAAPFDKAVRELDVLVDRIASENPRLAQRDRVQVDARALTKRLFLIRQSLLGQAPREQADQALLDLDMSWRQLENELRSPGQGNAESLKTLRREVDEVVARSREQLSRKPRLR